MFDLSKIADKKFIYKIYIEEEDNRNQLGICSYIATAIDGGFKVQMENKVLAPGIESKSKVETSYYPSKNELDISLRAMVNNVPNALRCKVSGDKVKVVFRSEDQEDIKYSIDYNGKITDNLTSAFVLSAFVSENTETEINLIHSNFYNLIKCKITPNNSTENIKVPLGEYTCHTLNLSADAENENTFSHIGALHYDVEKGFLVRFNMESQVFELVEIL